MDMARTAINVIGNGLASVVVAKWEGVFGSDLQTSPEPAPLAANLLEQH
jgi:Na+/H+-dicarboxylate symporter